MTRAFIIIALLFFAFCQIFAAPPYRSFDSYNYIYILQTSSKTQMDRKKIDELRKEQADNQIQMRALVLKYNNSKSEDEKKEAAEQITKLVHLQLAKELAEKKNILKVQRTRIDELEKRIEEVEERQDEFANKIVEFFLSPQGLVRIQRMDDNIQAQNQ
jgi:hypothetical protein